MNFAAETTWQKTEMSRDSESTGIISFPLDCPHPSSSFQQGIIQTVSSSFFAFFFQGPSSSAIRATRDPFMCRVPLRLSVSPCPLQQPACAHPDTLTSSERVDAAADLEGRGHGVAVHAVIGGQQSAVNSKCPWGEPFTLVHAGNLARGRRPERAEEGVRASGRTTKEVNASKDTE